MVKEMIGTNREEKELRRKCGILSKTKFKPRPKKAIFTPDASCRLIDRKCRPHSKRIHEYFSGISVDASRGLNAIAEPKEAREIARPHNLVDVTVAKLLIGGMETRNPLRSECSGCYATQVSRETRTGWREKIRANPHDLTENSCIAPKPMAESLSGAVKTRCCAEESKRIANLVAGCFSLFLTPLSVKIKDGRFYLISDQTEELRRRCVLNPVDERPGDADNASFAELRDWSVFLETGEDSRKSWYSALGKLQANDAFANDVMTEFPNWKGSFSFAVEDVLKSDVNEEAYRGPSFRLHCRECGKFRTQTNVRRNVPEKNMLLMALTRFCDDSDAFLTKGYYKKGQARLMLRFADRLALLSFALLASAEPSLRETTLDSACEDAERYVSDVEKALTRFSSVFADLMNDREKVLIERVLSDAVDSGSLEHGFLSAREVAKGFGTDNLDCGWSFREFQVCRRHDLKTVFYVSEKDSPAYAMFS